MEEIKLGEYCRTDTGEIYIMKYFIKEFDYSKTKHSSNIIDLVEVGDYVNGYKVLGVMENMNTGEIHLEMPMDYTNKELGDCTIYNKDIKSIVTKEAMKSVEYTIE